MHYLLKDVLSKEAEETRFIEELTVIHHMNVHLTSNETVTLIKYTILTDSIRCEDVLSTAKEKMEQAVSVPLLDWYQEQKEYLTKYWSDCNLKIHGEESLNQAVHFNMYQLLQSVGKDPYCNIAAKGLSGEGYEGHYFWDTEMYIEPFFTLTCPEITKKLSGKEKELYVYGEKYLLTDVLHIRKKEGIL